MFFFGQYEVTGFWSGEGQLSKVHTVEPDNLKKGETSKHN